jgi:hypothetical protein
VRKRITGEARMTRRLPHILNALRERENRILSPESLERLTREEFCARSILGQAPTARQQFSPFYGGHDDQRARLYVRSDSPGRVEFFKFLDKTTERVRRLSPGPRLPQDSKRRRIAFEHEIDMPDLSRLSVLETSVSHMDSLVKSVMTGCGMSIVLDSKIGGETATSPHNTSSLPIKSARWLPHSVTGGTLVYHLDTRLGGSGKKRHETMDFAWAKREVFGDPFFVGGGAIIPRVTGTSKAIVLHLVGSLSDMDSTGYHSDTDGESGRVQTSSRVPSQFAGEMESLLAAINGLTV